MADDLNDMPVHLIDEAEMENDRDWLSRLLEMIPVRGTLDYRCFLGAPWRIDFAASEFGEIAYHVILGGSAVLEDPEGGPTRDSCPGSPLSSASPPALDSSRARSALQHVARHQLAGDQSEAAFQRVQAPLGHHARPVAQGCPGARHCDPGSPSGR
jgi:Cupin